MGPNSEFPPTKQVSNRLNLQCVMFSLPSLINKYTPKLCTNYLTIVSCSCIKCVGPKYLSNSVWVTVFLWHLYKVHREIFPSYKYDRHYPMLFFLWIFFFYHRHPFIFFLSVTLYTPCLTFRNWGLSQHPLDHTRALNHVNSEMSVTANPSSNGKFLSSLFFDGNDEREHIFILSIPQCTFQF